MISLDMKCRHLTWICLTMIKEACSRKCRTLTFGILINIFYDYLEEAGSGSRSELMNYQPSPYNNNLDLNELLQNVNDAETGKLPLFEILRKTYSFFYIFQIKYFC